MHIERKVIYDDMLIVLILFYIRLNSIILAFNMKFRDPFKRMF